MLVASCMALAQPNAMQEAQSCAPGSPLPHFVLMSIDGHALHTSSLIGHPSVLSFWATWCAPCLKDMRVLDAAAGRFSRQNLAILGMIVDQPHPETVRLDIARGGAHYAQYLVPNDVEEAFDVQRGLPLTVFVDSRGVVHAMVRGPLTAAQLDSEILSILPRSPKRKR